MSKCTPTSDSAFSCMLSTVEPLAQQHTLASENVVDSIPKLRGGGNSRRKIVPKAPSPLIQLNQPKIQRLKQHQQRVLCVSIQAIGATAATMTQSSATNDYSQLTPKQAIIDQSQDFDISILDHNNNNNNNSRMMFTDLNLSTQQSHPLMIDAKPKSNHPLDKLLNFNDNHRVFRSASSRIEELEIHGKATPHKQSDSQHKQENEGEDKHQKDSKKNKNLEELPKEQSFLKKQQSGSTSNDEMSPGLKRWRKISQVVKAIQVFQCNDTKTIQPVDLADEIKNYRSSRKLTSPLPPVNFEKTTEMDQQLEKYHCIESFSLSCQRGSDDDLSNIKHILSTDPKRYIRSVTDPEHLINQSNRDGAPPLYVACLHQSLQIITFLLNLGVLPENQRLQKTGETCLEVAVRWRYVDVVRLLVENPRSKATISKSELKAALKNCGDHEGVREVLKAALNDSSRKNTSSGFFKCLFPCLFS